MLLLLAFASCLALGGESLARHPWENAYQVQLAQGQFDSNLGETVAISADGTVILTSSTFRSGALVFTRLDHVWHNQILLDGNTVESVALSADGNTALLGTPRLYENGEWNEVGAAWVYSRRNGTLLFSLEAKLDAGNAILGRASKQGAAVSLSADGNIALVGAPQDDPRVNTADDYFSGYGYVGASWVYVRDPNTRVWSRTHKLVAKKAYCLRKSRCQSQGYRVALSGNGRTALVYAHLPGEVDETVYLFARDTTTTKQVWKEHARKFAGGYWGFALSYNGKQLVIGGTGAFERQGEAKWVARSGGWEETEWGRGPVTLNEKGDLLVFGIDSYYGNEEMSYATFDASVGRWKRQGPISDFKARSLAMSGDGTTLVLGDGSAVWVLSNSVAKFTAAPTFEATTQAPEFTAAPTFETTTQAPEFTAAPTFETTTQTPEITAAPTFETTTQAPESTAGPTTTLSTALPSQRASPAPSLARPISNEDEPAPPPTLLFPQDSHASKVMQAWTTTLILVCILVNLY